MWAFSIALMLLSNQRDRAVDISIVPRHRECVGGTVTGFSYSQASRQLLIAAPPLLLWITFICFQDL